MKRIKRIFAASMVTLLLPFAIAAGQETKKEQKYIITTSSPEGNNTGKQIKKEVMIISSDSDSTDEKGGDTIKHSKCETLTDEKSYSFIIESDSRDKDSERTKYVISRDGIVITVEGSDYTKVKEVIEDIEKTLDKGVEVK